MAILDGLSAEIKKKAPHAKVLFRPDNAPCYKLMEKIAKLSKLRFDLLRHLLYPPDLAPSDYRLFADM